METRIACRTGIRRGSPVHRRGDRTARRTSRRGAAIVELALVAPLLLALILGVGEIGQSLRVQAAMSEASRIGCETASRPGSSSSDVRRDVKQALANSGLPAEEATITVLVNDRVRNVASAKLYDKVSVSISLPTAKTSWTRSSMFMGAKSIQSQTTIMLRQG
jgi:Flp pilus assembly protein TadG